MISIYLSGAYAGLILGGADFKKLGVRGLPPRKLIIFYPFVNYIIVLFVNFLGFVIFSLRFPPIVFFFQIGFFGGALHPFAPPVYMPDNLYSNSMTFGV